MVSGDMGFRLSRRGKLTYLRSPLLERHRHIDHAFSTRLGGCSSGAMASLNTAFHTGDRFESVLENRRLLLEPWGYRAEDVISAIQVHGAAVTMVMPSDRGRGALPGTFLGEYDALATAEAGALLTAYAADCFLIYLVEPQIPAIALAHAGWRGVLHGIARSAVAFLRRFGAEPPRILAAISPGICPGCYRVGEEIADLFKQAGWAKSPYLEPCGERLFSLNLSRIIAVQLNEAGIEAGNLAESSWCTACSAQLFYSYRRDGGVTGRMMGFLTIKPKRSGIT